VHFEPVVKLEQEVAVTTNEENESVEFKMLAFHFSSITDVVVPSCSVSQRNQMNGKSEAPEMSNS
jgi:hypothetical protein